MPQPQFTDADTIRILVATDNHVGYEERDSIRQDDGWKTFDEIMNLARTEDVDMVLLAGDLFHDNKPSRKSMYQVMRSLRKNCLGLKPCELEFMSDAAEVFHSAFSHVNYEDPDINISIPVFSIHGNHDDPSGDGNYCSLDLLQVAGLVNYFGRVPETDNIGARPVLLQKGQTKLALYGLSNVRDERMHRTFRDHGVKWFRPTVQTSDWFNLLAVHQNHHAHGPTNYLPEEFLPEWLNLVVWGHEHECLIDPSQNPTTGFHVMQPGSSIATSLIPGEAVPKHVAIVSITGKDFQVEKHRLKSVRPFVIREVVLSSDKRFKGLDKKKDNRQELTRRLMNIVEEMIEEANEDWRSIQENETTSEEQPLPLIRLKVEYTAVDGGSYEVENPQRFSNRFQGKVANQNDVVYFYRKKTVTRQQKAEAVPEEVLQSMGMDANHVEKLVEAFLENQPLKILPGAPFGDAVNQFVQKDDKHAMSSFVDDSLTRQVQQLMSLEDEDQDLNDGMAAYKAKLENQFKAGTLKSRRRVKTKPKPDQWDSDLDGHWEDQPGVVDYGDEEKSQPSKPQGRGKKAAPKKVDSDMNMDMDMDDVEESAPKPKGRGRAAAKPAAAKATKKPPAKKPPAKGRGRKAIFEEDDDGEEEESFDFIDDDEEDDDVAPPPKRTAATRSQPARSQTTTRSQPSRAAAASKPKQMKLSFASQKTSQKPLEISDDEISDDDDFDPPAKATSGTRKR